MTKFSVATDVGYGENKKTTWLTCSTFGKAAEVAARYLKKGSKVFITGEVRQYSPEKGTMYWDVIVDQMRFLDPKEREERNENIGF